MILVHDDILLQSSLNLFLSGTYYVHLLADRTVARSSGRILIGRIHGAIVAATVEAIVTATNTYLIEQPTGDCRRNNHL